MLQKANKHLTDSKTQRNSICVQQHERQYSIVKLFRHVQYVSKLAKMARFLRKLTPTSTILQQKCSDKLFHCTRAPHSPLRSQQIIMQVHYMQVYIMQIYLWKDKKRHRISWSNSSQLNKADSKKPNNVIPKFL